MFMCVYVMCNVELAYFAGSLFWCQYKKITRYILLVLANSLLFNLSLGPLLVSASLDPIDFGVLIQFKLSDKSLCVCAGPLATALSKTLYTS